MNWKTISIAGEPPPCAGACRSATIPGFKFDSPSIRGPRAAIARQPFLTPPAEVAGGDLDPRPLRQADQEAQVVQRQKPHREDLARDHEVAQVGPREGAAGITIALRVERPFVEPVPGGLQVDLPLRRDPGG